MKKKKNQPEDISTHLLAIGLACGMRPGLIGELFALCNDPEKLVRKICSDQESLISQAPHPTSKLIKAIHSVSDKVFEAAKLVVEMDHAGICFITRMDYDYPKRLLRFMGEGAPWFLFYTGNKKLLEADSFLGIVGTRYPSGKGYVTSEFFARKAAEHDTVVVSGGAKGIDEAAHIAAMEEGSTIIIVPSGQTFYRGMKKIRRRFKSANHLLLSEFPPGQPGTRSTPVQRNRTVAALSDALLVVETGTSGGTLHTVRFARELKKPILVADFSPDKNPEGNQSLIKTIGGDIQTPGEGKKVSFSRIDEALKKGRQIFKKEPIVQEGFL